MVRKPQQFPQCADTAVRQIQRADAAAIGAQENLVTVTRHGQYDVEGEPGTGRIPAGQHLARERVHLTHALPITGQVQNPVAEDASEHHLPLALQRDVFPAAGTGVKDIETVGAAYKQQFPVPERIHVHDDRDIPGRKVPVEMTAGPVVNQKPLIAAEIQHVRLFQRTKHIFTADGEEGVFLLRVEGEAQVRRSPQFFLRIQEQEFYLVALEGTARLVIVNVAFDPAVAVAVNAETRPDPDVAMRVGSHCRDTGLGEAVFDSNLFPVIVSPGCQTRQTEKKAQAAFQKS